MAINCDSSLKTSSAPRAGLIVFNAPPTEAKKQSHLFRAVRNCFGAVNATAAKNGRPVSQSLTPLHMPSQQYMKSLT